jgi:AcrR family transcriptional regulator
MIDAPLTLPGRREKRKQEIRNRIEDAAYDIFKRDGIHETSIEQVCDAADVARRTFYGHYPNKQALLQALSQSRVWGTADEMIHRIRDTHDSTHARMSAMIDYMEQKLSTYEAVDRALILIAPSSFEDKNHLREVSNSLRDHFIGFFSVGQKNGDTSADYSPELLAEMVMGTINALMANWAMNPDYPIFEKLEEARGLFESVITPAVQREC